MTNFYRAFEDRHRGSRELIKHRLQIYLPFIEPLRSFDPQPSAIDLGCGRGEWLELLTELGFNAIGVDLDEGMLRACQQLGLTTLRQDAIKYLASLPDESQTVISGFHMAEHILFEDLKTLVQQALRVLKPGGLLILETPNPENIVVGCSNFYLDPTHNKPIPPALLAFIPEYCGYVRVKILRLHESENLINSDQLQLINVLNGVSPDYAVIAQKNADEKILAASTLIFDQDHGFSLETLAAKYDQQTEGRIEQANINAAAGEKENFLLQISNLQLEKKLLENELTYINEKYNLERSQLEKIITTLNYEKENFLLQISNFQLEKKLLENELTYINGKNNLEIFNLEATITTLKAEVNTLHHKSRKYTAIADGIIQEKIQSNNNAHQQLNQIYNSYSWRITYPLRLISKLTKTIINKPITLITHFYPFTQKQLFIDISEFIQKDANSGIQRVTRNILRELLINPPPGFKVQPVYASFEHQYYYARKFTSRFLNYRSDTVKDERIKPKAGDIFIGLDLQPNIIPHHQLYFKQLYQTGIKVFFVVYDLLPVLYPHYFPPEAETSFRRWLDTITNSNGAICISRSVAKDLKNWITTHDQLSAQPFDIGYFHLGANIESPLTSPAIADNFVGDFEKIHQQTSILMVGTIEPRKGYQQALDAFEQLWKNDLAVNLVIVGKQGWMVETLIERLEQHPEKNHRLFWFKDVNDQTLLKFYQMTAGVLVASEAEGFGLPLIEAAQHKRPILARDIAVFREVAAEHVSYFPDDKHPETLARSLQNWLDALNAGKAIPSDNMTYLTWSESAKQLMSLVVDKNASHWLYRLGSQNH